MHVKTNQESEESDNSQVKIMILKHDMKSKEEREKYEE